MNKTVLALLAGVVLGLVLPRLVRGAAAASDTQVHRINQ